MSGSRTTTNGHATVLRPTQYLEDIQDGRRVNGTGPGVALIILNSPLTGYEYVKRLYGHASYVLCADGGANRLHDLILAHSGSTNSIGGLRDMLPNLIHGDLDSLDDKVRQRYKSLGVEISEDPDQYSTDFGKGVKTVLEQCPNIRDILILGSLGGRVDQGIGLLHELYREQMVRHAEVRFWLFSESSVSVILAEGTTTLQTPLESGLMRRNIGILPLYGPAVISTKGMEWDVDDWPTEMGGQVSTSNHIMADEITITTDRAVLFTVERDMG
ncbi:thiamine pyrophosphokinase [Recurvomyces mirabilis]|uniref:Thiamine pyrophosphokinase n=1 Tax=Recurvomyces mirabilis TaxID=574656 RepID=A0AAE0WH98_9PEZI|nr:thiamine pyrophosphokinase [Recurvomyces mirabilis]KAK5156378.1 thiamine pyrophosphokinase [Recurvomyces mirabilis]